ncbi:hypothetical protein N7540_012940 [Penicillium herquei]|nr:hypothetical protein N7540_012940 [Penicillium herquei]
MTSLTSTELEEWPQSRQPAIYGVCAVMLLLGNLAVPMRIWAQWKVHRKTFMEDYFLVAALLFANVGTIATIIAGTKGLGLHTFRIVVQDPSYKNLVSVFASIWVTALFNGPSIFATKVALLAYYRRLFIVNQTWLKITWWINLVFATLLCIGTILFYILQCSPVNWYWERVNAYTKETGTCVEPLGDIGAPLVLSMVSDLAILLLPIITVITLKMDLKRKLGLTAVFSVGFVSFGCSLARVTVLLAGTEMADDDTWTLTAFEILSVVELTCAILCASAVPIFSYFRLLIRGRREESTASHDGYGFKDISASRLKKSRGSWLASSSSEHLREEYTSNSKDPAVP